MLLDFETHRQLKSYVSELNKFYLRNAPFWEADFSPEGFGWIVGDDDDNSVLAYLRRDNSGNEIISVCNLTGVTRNKYRIGVPKEGTYRVVFSSAKPEFGGRNESTVGSVRAKKKPMHGYDYSIEIDIEGLSCMYIKNTSRKNKP
jgi:1,4-alpha-glucan branching enzyme